MGVTQQVFIQIHTGLLYMKNKKKGKKIREFLQFRLQ